MFIIKFLELFKIHKLFNFQTLDVLKQEKEATHSQWVSSVVWIFVHWYW